MAPELGRAALRWALLIVLLALGLLLGLKPGTPEFAITLLTLLIGILFLGVVVAAVRFLGR
jgi:hypothetical protein